MRQRIAYIRCAPRPPRRPRVPPGPGHQRGQFGPDPDPEHTRAAAELLGEKLCPAQKSWLSVMTTVMVRLMREVKLPPELRRLVNRRNLISFGNSHKAKPCMS